LRELEVALRRGGFGAVVVKTQKLAAGAERVAAEGPSEVVVDLICVVAGQHGAADIEARLGQAVLEEEAIEAEA